MKTISKGQKPCKDNPRLGHHQPQLTSSHSPLHENPIQSKFRQCTHVIFMLTMQFNINGKTKTPHHAFSGKVSKSKVTNKPQHAHIVMQSNSFPKLHGREKQTSKHNYHANIMDEQNKDLGNPSPCSHKVHAKQTHSRNLMEKNTNMQA